MPSSKLTGFTNHTEKKAISQQAKIKWSNRRICISFLLLLVVALVALSVMIVFIVKYHQLIHVSDVSQVTKGKFPKSLKLFGGFSAEDYNSVLSYLMEQHDLHLVPARDADLNSNYVYDIDIHLPSKNVMIGYLEGFLPEPIRKARVTLFMGRENPKEVRELVVWPVSKPTNHTDIQYPTGKKPTWQSRPVCPYVEGAAMDRFLADTLAPLRPLLEAHYGNWIGANCSTKCLYCGTAPRLVAGQTDRVIMLFFHPSYSEFMFDYYLHMTSLGLLLYTPGNGDVFAIKSLYYDDVEYRSPAELLEAYRNGTIASRVPAVFTQHNGRYGSAYRRGPDLNPAQHPPPAQTGDGQARFSVDGRHVSWLGWEFDFHFRILSMFQLFNVVFNKERIAFEIGLQEIIVTYTGPEPSRTFMSFWDGGWQLGLVVSPLLRGYDCPQSAEYISSETFDPRANYSLPQKDIACVFEYTNSVPMRRHFSTDFSNTGGYRFKFSMPDTVLVFRQIVTAWNYDYIIDVELHQNGVIEVKFASSGYILTAYTPDGSQLHGYHILPAAKQQALIHTHFFETKIDLDIAGTRNRFKTVDIDYETQVNKWNPQVNTSYYVMKEHLRTTEKDALIKYDFTKPKHLIVYNEHDRNGFNNYSRGYKIHSNSFAHPIFPDTDLLTSRWLNHQVAVTKLKDNESGTISYFSQGNPFDPIVSVGQFVEDNENIVDEDLVAWVMVGIHHVPTMEDIPVATTAGKILSLCLMPYNYFEEDPSIWSRDAKLLTDDE